jgi:hypothetical protein
LFNGGSIAIAFGTSRVFGAVTNAVTGLVVVSGGSQATFYDDVVNNGAINVSASGALQSTAVFFGALSGNGVAGGGIVFIEGDMRPGFSPGTMAFGGDLSFGSLAAVEIEIGGTTPGSQFDEVRVAGSLFLGGTLEVSTIGGYSPTLPGEEFTIVTAGSRTGEFSEVLGTPSASLPGLHWTVRYTSTEAILTTSALPGDLDLDGDVDRADAAKFIRFLGLAASDWTTGDFDNDNRTTLADLALLQSHMGTSISPSIAATAVPEPSTALLLFPIALFAPMRRNRSRFAV